MVQSGQAMKVCGVVSQMDRVSGSASQKIFAQISRIIILFTELDASAESRESRTLSSASRFQQVGGIASSQPPRDSAVPARSGVKKSGIRRRRRLRNHW